MLCKLFEESLFLKFQQIYLKATVSTKHTLRREGIKKGRHNKNTITRMKNKMEMIENLSNKRSLGDSLIHRNETLCSMTITKHFSGRDPQVQCRPPEQAGEKHIPQYSRYKKTPKFSPFVLSLHFFWSTLTSRLCSRNFTFFFSYKDCVCVRKHMHTWKPQQNT